MLLCSKKFNLRNRLLSLIRTKEFIYVEPLFSLFYDIKKLFINIFKPVLNYTFEIFESNKGFDGHYKTIFIETFAFF